MKLSSAVPIAIAVLGAEVALAAPAGVDVEDASASPSTAEREVHPGAKGHDGVNHDDVPLNPAHGPDDHPYTHATNGHYDARDVANLTPPQQPEEPAGPYMDRKAKRTLVTVASGSGTTSSDAEATAPAGGTKLKSRVPVHPGERPGEPEPGHGHDDTAELDDRETPCVAENDCGGVYTPAPASSAAPPPTSSTTSTTHAAEAPFTTTLPNALTPVPNPSWGTPIVITSTPEPALSCWEAQIGQVHCVPWGTPMPTSTKP